MGVDVVLMRVIRQGASPKRRRWQQAGLVSDADGVLARMLPVSGKPMLSRVDPYRDLILTSVEMGQFIAEVESLIPGASARDAERIRLVLDLARKCQDDPDAELHLQGD